MGHDADPLQHRTRLRLALLSVTLAALIMGVKFVAWTLTGSAAILSDALESIINVVAGGFAVFSVITAAKPADESHPYGHGKIEYFSAGFEGALIVLAAGGIIWHAVPRLVNPAEIPCLDIGLLVILGASAVNLGLGIALLVFGRRTRSLTLVADGKHVLTDVYTSLGVLLGLGLIRLTGWLWLDGATAIVVAVNILFSGWALIKESYTGLMHTADPALLEELCELLRRHRKPDWIDVHQLRAWRAGNHVFTDFHLILPREYNLEQGHTEVKAIERIIKEHFQGLADVFIHLDPCIEEECRGCSRSPCLERNEGMDFQHLWNPRTVTTHKRAAGKPLRA